MLNNFQDNTGYRESSKLQRQWAMRKLLGDRGAEVAHAHKKSPPHHHARRALK
jgi:hypothetical protein